MAMHAHDIFLMQTGTDACILSSALGEVLFHDFPARALLVGGVRPHHCKGSRFMSPTAILQVYLDRIGKAVLSERFEEYRSFVQLPLSIQTASASMTISNDEDLLDGFDAFNDMLRSHGVTDMIRPVKAAVFQGTDHIVGVYETRLMRDSQQVLPTFHSKMWLGCFSGIWKAMEIHNTTKDARWPILLTRLPPDNWLSEET